MKTVITFLLTLHEELLDAQQPATAKSYRTVMNSLSRFLVGRTMCFSDLTVALLREYETYLVREGCCLNTRSLYLRKLHHAHILASERGVCADPGNLYKGFFTGSDPSEKRAVTAETIALIRDANLSLLPKRLAFARDLFMLCVYLRGIPFVDLAHLRKSDLRNGVITYCRSKTGKRLHVHVEPCAYEIILRYLHTDKHSPYLLPILKDTTATDSTMTYNNSLRLQNKHLHELSEVLGLEQKISTYVARHSWATLAHVGGVDMPYISEAMSHSKEETTRRYLKGIDPDILAEVNQYVIHCIDKPKEKFRQWRRMIQPEKKKKEKLRRDFLDDNQLNIRSRLKT